MSAALPPIDAAAYRANLLRSIPLVLLVPVVIGGVIALAGFEFDLWPLVLGGVGWLIALVLRAPVAIVATRAMTERSRVQSVVTGSSGPLEELVRLAIVLFVGNDLESALWIGLGWGAIEAVYSLINGAALLTLVDRMDPEAEQVRALLPMPDVLRADAPLWGVLERTWASALHIGFTVLVAASPLLVLITIAAHSATNLLLLRLSAAWGLVRVQAAGVVWAVVVLAAAWLAWTVA